MRLSGAVCLALAVAVAVAAAAVPAQARDVQPRRQLKQLDGAPLRGGKLAGRPARSGEGAAGPAGQVCCDTRAAPG